MTDFVMPSLGAGMESGTVVRWRRAAGDAVKKGDIVAEVETEKGIIEIETFIEGVLERIVVSEGVKVPVGAVLAVLRERGESPSSPALASSPVLPASETGRETPSEAPHGTPAARALAREGGVSLERVEPTGRHGTITRADVARALDARAMPAERARISPRARALAASRGVALEGVSASAADGVVRAIDVERAAPPAVTPSRAEAQRAAMRRAIATAMTRSKREIPHYYVSHTIDVTPMLEQLRERNAKRPVRERAVPAAALLLAVVRALADVPELNAWWTGESAPPRPDIHLGVAIALRGGGLVAPAILDAGRMGLDELMRALDDVVARARTGALRARELSDATITVTSLGERGVEAVFPIIHPPQVAMIGLGKIVERPWVVGGELRARSVITVSLAGDHRATDGHRGGLFLARIEAHLASVVEST